MMRMFLLYFGLGIVVLWWHVTLGRAFFTPDLRPNWVFLYLLPLLLHRPESWVLFYGAALGLALDGLSHLHTGVYAFSFLATLVLARTTTNWFYSGNSLFLGIATAFFSLISGLISLLLLNLLESELGWGAIFWSVTLPTSVLHGLLAPVVVWGLARLEHSLLEPAS